jgi:hypothetical protein
MLLLLAAIVSLMFFWLAPSHHVARALYFPGTTDPHLSSERRLVPRSNGIERSVELVVEEALLGPMLISHGRLFPHETAARTVIVSDDTAFIDLNEAAMREEADVRIGVADAIEALRLTVERNFHSLKNVVVTINGNLPFVPAYR